MRRSGCRPPKRCIGITTVHDWCHNVRSREHPEGDLRALADVGIRAHFSIGQRIDQPDDTLMPLDIVEAVHADLKQHYANDGLISLGMAWRGMFRNSGRRRQSIVPSWNLRVASDCRSRSTSARSPRAPGTSRLISRRTCSAPTSTSCMHARPLRTRSG